MLKRIWRVMRSLQREELLSARSLYFLLLGICRHGCNMLAPLYQAARMHPAETALCVAGEPHDDCLDWQTLYDESLLCAAALSAMPAWQTRQRVALLCRSRRMSVVSLCALNAGGMPVLLVNADMSASQLAVRLQNYAPALLLTDDDLQDKVENLPYHRLSMKELREAMAAVRMPVKPPRRAAGAIRVMADGDIAQGRINPLGMLKPIPALLETLAPHRRRCLYLAPPLYQGYGLAAFCLALLLRRQILLTPHFHAPTAARLIHRQQADMLAVTPALLSGLLNEMADGAPLKTVLTAGAPLSLHLAIRTRRQWGDVLYNLYGTAETGLVLAATPDMLAQKPNSIGRPFPGVNVLLRKTDGRLCSANEIGELWVETSYFSGRGRQLLFTGDLAYRDADGDIFLKGRADEMIICGGENVYPQDVRSVVLRHPGISRAAVIPVEDALFGQRVVLFAQPRDGRPDPHDLRLWLAKYLARAQMPARIVFMRQLPDGESDGTNKSELLTVLARMRERDGWARNEKTG